jgi:tRNA dimethylallyltransferase
LQSLSEKKRDVVFVVGGSGFYIQALEKGMFDFGKVEHSIHEKVKREAEEGLSALFQELLQQDPAYAKKIGPTDSYRITRAVELMRMFGKTPTQLRDEFVPVPFPYPVVKLGFMMDRDTLFHKVSLRTKKMLQLGLVQEVKSVLEQTSEDWPPLSSIGYKEVLRFLRGELPAESLETEIVQNTMRLAKRQKTWFRRDTEIHWFDPSQGFDGPLHELQVKLRL